MTLLSYHNNSETKKFYQSQVRQHYAHDEIIKGKYWENGKGCAVGCLIHSSEHNKFPEILGWPEWLARLMETIFESLPNDVSRQFPLQVVDAVPIGVDLEPVKNRFCSFLMDENSSLVQSLDIREHLKNKILTVIRECKELHDAEESTELAAWSKVWSESLRLVVLVRMEGSTNAIDSAAYAAQSVMDATNTGWSSAPASSASKAANAVWSKSWSVRLSASFEKYAKKLLELIGETK
jgi:hypothetical protein